MPAQLSNKVAIVTGAAGGIGRAVAQRFLAEGASVVALDRAEAPLPGQESRYVSLVGDVRNADSHQRAVASALERFGRLDVLVANAGVYDNRRRFDSYAPDELDRAFAELFDINVKGYLLAALAAAPALAAARGAIVFTGSISGAHAGFGGALYVAAKHAVHGLTRQLALELAPRIRVNAVAPGYVPTGLQGLESLGQARQAGGPAASDLPLQALATPEDFADAYVYLACEASARIATGTIMNLDGGSALRGPRA